MRRDVAAVGESVNPGAVAHTLPARKVEQSLEVVEMRMDAAFGDEPEQMDVAPTRFRALEGAEKRRILEQGAVADRGVHPLQILEEDPTGPDRQMADLGVAHLPGRQADRLAGSREGGVRVLCPDPVEDGCARELHGIAGTGRRATPAVEDDERYEVDAAWQIAAKESGSSEAPPTSAPSIEGWARSSAAFSGLTEPP